MALNPDIPEILFSDSSDPAAARRISRLAAAGQLRKLHAGIYTPNLDSPAETIVARNWHRIAGKLAPGGVMSHRSAFDGKPHDGRLILTRGKTRRLINLPGLEIHIFPGYPAQADGIMTDTPYGALFLSSEPRRLLENLVVAKGWADKVLPRQEIENYLDRVLSIRGEARLNELRDHARLLSARLGFDTQMRRLDGIVGALMGTHATKKLRSKQAVARAQGRPYDPDRLHVFDTLFGALNSSPLPEIPSPATTARARENFAFLEAYFSNFIEGTTFTVEEAEDIVFKGRHIANRHEDAHDVLGTFQAATRPPWRDRPPATVDAFLQWLMDANALIMLKRPERNPGQWKDKPNQSGSTLFVLPDLVPGTLREGFDRIMALGNPLARALMTMFVVTEVHPFRDGNGRTARLAMNCHLSAAGLCRIIVPTVYREDYLSPLKALSNNRNPQPLLAAMSRAQAWSAAFSYDRPLDGVEKDMAACNAFKDDLINFKLLFPENAAKPL